MKNINKFSKIFLFITTLSGALWMGSYMTRLFIVFQIFDPQFNLKPFITDENLTGILYAINSAVVTTFVLYIIFILSYIIFVSTSKMSLKKNGWLFIISLIILITLPFELFLMTIDYKIIKAVNAGGFDPQNIIKLIVRRNNIFSSFPLVEIFCYFAIVFFAVFKPLKVKDKDDHEN